MSSARVMRRAGQCVLSRCTPCFPSSTEVCTVRSVRAWLDAAGISEGSIFRAVNQNGRVRAARLSDRAVALAAQRADASIGLAPRRSPGTRSAPASPSRPRGKALLSFASKLPRTVLPSSGPALLPARSSKCSRPRAERRAAKSRARAPRELRQAPRRRQLGPGVVAQLEAAIGGGACIAAR